MKKLAALVSASEVRMSPLPWLLANVLSLWDLRCMVKMEAWRMRNGHALSGWFDAVAQFEALSSIAVLRFDHPGWVFPTITDGALLHIEADGMGHPLIPGSQRVDNDFSLGGPSGTIAIITGSNMSGKSTFLRTVGINVVLAGAGAPVCARRCTIPLIDLYTSMRTTDDLHSQTSTFYAELLRIRTIVDALATGKPLLYLLDELFSGTNSIDRHDGAVALLETMSRYATLGLVSTHDLALCSLADRAAPFRNYHFAEQYETGGLHFDYRLKSGPSTTRNAVFLMRMAGIDVGGSQEL
jgi:DNA mismatch repair ATPase MutS